MNISATGTHMIVLPGGGYAEVFDAIGWPAAPAGDD
jgi:hypothetical protein